MNVIDYSHWSLSDLSMFMSEMLHLPCESKFTIYIPEVQHQASCPKVLVICHSPHAYPIPIPATTPELIKHVLRTLLLSIRPELPDLTPCWLLRLPLLHSFLQISLPRIDNPMLTDLHPSLANLDHIKALIDQTAKSQYPKETGWDSKVLEYMHQHNLYSIRCTESVYTAVSRPSIHLNGGANDMGRAGTLHKLQRTGGYGYAQRRLWWHILFHLVHDAWKQSWTS